MATDSFETASGAQAWDVAGNWSLGAVPGSTDDVVYTGPVSSDSSVTITAADPAYTVASLTESTTNTAALSQVLIVSGELTVTGATSITSGVLSERSGGSLNLNTVTLSNSAEISNGGLSSTLAITALSAGSGLIGGTVIVGPGTATIGAISGAVTVSVDAANAAATVGSSSGSGFFNLSNGGRLNLQSASTALADTINLAGKTGGVIDLQTIGYQIGETYSESLVSSGIFNVYSITLESAGGQPIYTFERVSGVGNLNAQTAPVVNLASDDVNGTFVSLACYADSTLIGVPGGATRAGALQIGDLVLTQCGDAKPIKWVGRRSYAGRFLAGHPAILPIRIARGALGSGLPLRDLLVSPCHAMLLDGVLVPAGCLVNGTTIRQEAGASRVDYVHIELDQHSVILAEGAPSETFLDDDSRGVFQNAAEFAALYPDASGHGPFCAPRVTDGYRLEAIRQLLPTAAQAA